MMEEAINQVADDDATQEDIDAENGIEQELDEDGNPVEAEEAEEEEEIELDDDLKLRLPKSQAEKLRQHALRQADYTRKTQELAETRKAFEAERQSLIQADEMELTARANITAIERQLQQFQQVNWNQFNDDDPFEAQKAFQQFQLLKDAKTNAENYLTRTREERTVQQQQESAKRLQEGAEVLRRDIPEWSPELSAKLVSFGQNAFGMSKEDFDGIDDPRAVKLLHAAYQWHQHQDSANKAKTIQKQQEVTPAASVGKGKSAPPSGLDDRLSAEEWLRRREAQLAKRG